MARRFVRILPALACAGLLAAPGSALAGKRAGKKATPEPAHPTVHLSISTHHGFSPLTVTLTAHLSGVADTNQQFCHVGVEWERQSPLGIVTSSMQDPRCLHPPEQVHIEHVFTKTVTLRQVGTYVYRLILHRKDGQVLQSNTQEVRVLRPN